jgi:hypothetical protein
MDAESAAAMWQEANCPICTQRIILQHLFNQFGRRITVPEQRMKDLEVGNLPPTTSSVTLDGNEVFFWYKKIDEVTLNRVKMEVQRRGSTFFLGYNPIDVVFGGDHGARHFRAVTKLIFRSNVQPDLEPFSIVMQVGNIDIAKDTRSVLERTLGIPLNESLKRVHGKKVVVHLLDNDTPAVTLTLTEELPGEQENNNFISFHVWSFITGDLAFFATILGKENMSTKWCTWCKLFRVEWSNPNHVRGEPWSIEGIQEVHFNVMENNLLEMPENIMGCTAIPLFDAVYRKFYCPRVASFYRGRQCITRVFP